jgi:hypothetical protein
MARTAREKSVEVISVSRATESQTGDTTFQVIFGIVAEVDSELRPYLPQTPGSHPPKTLGFNSVVLFYPFKGEVPYKVGSKWKLIIESDGKLTIAPKDV